MSRLSDERVKEALERARKDAFYEHDPQRPVQDAIDSVRALLAEDEPRAEERAT